MNKLSRLLRRSITLDKPRTMHRMFSSKRELVEYAHGSLEVIDKAALVRSLCLGKEVLDLGCIDHSYETALTLGDEWLHKQISQVSKSLTGLDILADDARRLNERGYSIVVGDAESFNLRRTFDVIVAGDLIEHLSNTGLFLSSVRNHMHSESIAIITTPNPFNIEQTMLGLFEDRIAVNEQHTTWIDPNVMYELTRRADLQIVDFYWVDTRFKLRTKRKIAKHFANNVSELLMRVRPLFRRDFAVVLAKSEHGKPSHQASNVQSVH